MNKSMYAIVAAIILFLRFCGQTNDVPGIAPESTENTDAIISTVESSATEPTMDTSETLPTGGDYETPIG